MHLPDLTAIRTEIARRKRDVEVADLLQNVEAVRAQCESLHQFVLHAWKVLEPEQPFIDGWHIQAICEHLEAVTHGRLTRLLINVPPGTSKSLIVSVFWPAWEWGPMARPHLRYLTTSYSEDYVKRDSRRMRDLVRSEWYQAHWGNEVSLTRAGEISFANSRTGTREGMPFASLTGGRGDRVIIDDPHSTEKAESQTERATATRIFRESVPTRVNDPVRSAIVVIMQRLHSNDVSGVAISNKLGYEHLMLPMEFEPGRRCMTSIGFRDPREHEGDLLCPERFPRDVVERDKRTMGSYAVAGQFQQRPAPREGGMFRKEKIEIVPAAPADCEWCRGWDLAGTKGGGAWTAGVRIGRHPSGRFFISDCARFQGSPAEVEATIKNVSSQDGISTLVSLPQDPGSAGKWQAQYLVGKLAGYRVKASPESGDKVGRAEPFAAQVEVGNVALVKGDWNEIYLEELGLFPNSTFMDQVDASSRAFSEVAKVSAMPSVISL